MGNLPEQISSLALVFLTGFAWGIYHDFYLVWSGQRFGRRSLSRGVWDLVFWLGAFVLLGVGLIAGNWLELRLYVFFGLGLGYIAYALLISPVLRPVYRGVVTFLTTVGDPWRRLGERWLWWWRRGKTRERLNFQRANDKGKEQKNPP